MDTTLNAIKILGTFNARRKSFHLEHALSSTVLPLNFFFRDAMDDADKILNTLKDSTNPKALTVKGDALYNLGNFEHALLNYHRAMRSSSTKVM